MKQNNNGLKEPSSHNKINTYLFKNGDLLLLILQQLFIILYNYYKNITFVTKVKSLKYISNNIEY